MIANQIKSLQHPLVKFLVSLRKDKKIREEHGSVLISGRKMVREIGLSYPIKTLILLEGEVPPDLPCDQLIYVTDSILKKITGLEAPEPIAAEVSLPENNLKAYKHLLVFDEIQDPGNLGTLIRTGHALGWDGALLTPNCVDPFNEKALRSAKGSTFFFPCPFMEKPEISTLVQEKNLQVFVADIDGENTKTIHFSQPLLLILGNEANGVSPWAKALGRSISIPISKDVDSLNVAVSGAIFMYLMRKT